MNCIYCQNPCYLGVYSANGNATQREEWICDKHPLEVRHHISFEYPHKPDCHNPECCPKPHFYFVFMKVPFRKSYLDFYHYQDTNNILIESNDKIILTFSPTPKSITPENIQHKLSLYVTFS